MQTVTRVVQHFFHPPAVKRLQAMTKLVAHLLRTGTFLPSRNFVMLVDVVVLQTLKGLHGLVQTRRGHAPSANRRAHQINRLLAARQPFAKQKAVQRTQNQTLGATCCGGNHVDMMRSQAVLMQVRQGFGASVNV